MSQLHHRFSNKQVLFLFQAYEQGLMSREEVQDALDIHRSRFFVLLKEYRTDPETFTITYERKTPRRISLEAETAIKRELLREKTLIDDPEIPISGYNCSAFVIVSENKASRFRSTPSSIGLRSLIVINLVRREKSMTGRC